MSEGDFIAADLTLYSNPLNRALGKLSNTTPSPAPKANTPANDKAQPTKEEAKKGQGDEEEEEIIAADLTTYDSPMGQLERSERQRAINQEEEIKKAASDKKMAEQDGDE